MRQSDHENQRDDKSDTPAKNQPQGSSRFRNRDYAEQREDYPDDSDRR